MIGLTILFCQIFMGVTGLVALIRNRFPYRPGRPVDGLAAYVAGSIMLMPLVIGIPVEMSIRESESLAEAIGKTLALHICLIVGCFTAAYLAAALLYSPTKPSVSRGAMMRDMEKRRSRRRKRMREDDEDDDRPRRRRRDRDDDRPRSRDDDDDRPRRGDDDDDRPRRRDDDDDRSRRRDVAPPPPLPRADDSGDDADEPPRRRDKTADRESVRGEDHRRGRDDDRRREDDDRISSRRPRR
jgi:hypothetical protein